MALFRKLKRRFLYRRISSRLLFTKLVGKFIFSGATMLNQRIALRKRLGIFSDTGSEMMIKNLFKPIGVKAGGRKGFKLKKVEKRRTTEKTVAAVKKKKKPIVKKKEPEVKKPEPELEPELEDIGAAEDIATEEFLDYQKNLKRILDLMENLNYSDEEIDLFMQKVNAGNYTWQELQEMREEYEEKWKEFHEDAMDFLDEYAAAAIAAQERGFWANLNFKGPFSMFRSVLFGKVARMIAAAMKNLFSWEWLKESLRYKGPTETEQQRHEEKMKEIRDWKKKLKANLGRGLGYQ